MSLSRKEQMALQEYQTRPHPILSYLILSYLHAIETQFFAQINVHLFDIAELVYFVYSNITSIKQRGFSYLIPNAAKLRSKESIRCKNRNHKRSRSSGAAVGCRVVIRHRDQIEVALQWQYFIFKTEV